MTPDQIARLVFLCLLGAVILFWMFRGSRQSLNRILQQVVVWALLFVGVVAGFGLWKDIERSATFRQNVSSQTGEITSPRALDGHYYLTLEVNGEPVRFVVDTGASDMVLTRQDAETAVSILKTRPFTAALRRQTGWSGLHRSRSKRLPSAPSSTGISAPRSTMARWRHPCLE